MKWTTLSLALATLTLIAGSLSAEGHEITRRQLDPSLDLDALTSQKGALPPTRFENVAGEAVFNLVYDDGEADNGYSASSEAFAYDLAMRFDLGTAPVEVQEVSVCFSRLGADDEIDFDLTFWAADGPGGSPGTLIDFVSAIAEGVPSDLAGTFYTYDLTGLGVILTSPTVYIGAGWDPSLDVDFFLCSDYDRNPVQPGYSMVNLDDNWGTPPAGDDQYTALMIRGQFDTIEGTGTCTSSSTALCLQDGRFRVEVDWERSNGAVGVGTAVQLTPDTGYFWFFNQANVEMVVKVLDNCSGFSNRFWVFAGGLTNVEVEMTVTDTQTDTVRTYSNPQSTPFQPIQDTNAFATCP